MMRHLTWIAALFLLDGGICSAQENNWLTFPAGLKYSLVEKADALSVRIPVRPAAAAPSGTKSVQLRDVAGPEGRVDDLLSVLSLTLNPESTTTGATIAVNSKLITWPPGTYTVSFDAVIDGTTAGRQPVVLTLERPAAQLTATRAVRVWQVRGVCSSDFTAGRLCLTETGNKAAVRELNVTVLRDVPSTAIEETGTLEVTVQGLPLAPQHDLELAVTPVGDLPLGKTTGKIRLQSPQMSAPLIVDYEVYARRALWWIPICAVLGTVAGWLLRVHLQQKREKLKALREASEALGQLNETLAQIPDATFQGLIRSAMDDLQTAAGDRRQPTEISQAAKTALAAIKPARDNLEERRKQLADKFEPRFQSAMKTFRLPTEANAALEVVRTVGREILSAVERHDIRGAQKVYEESFEESWRKTMLAARRQRAQTAEYLEALVRNPPALLAADLQVLEAAVVSWTTANADARGPDPTVFENPAWEAELQKTHDQSHAARTLLKAMLDGADRFADEFGKALKSDADPTPLDLVDAFRRDRRELLMAGLDRPAEHTSELPQLSDEERRLWTAAVVAWGRDAGNAIQTLIGQGKWDDALGAADLANRPAPVQNQAAAAAIMPQAGAVAAAAETAGRAVEPSPMVADGPPLPTRRSVPPLLGTPEEREQFEREESTASVLQAVILGLIFIALAVVIYGDRWVGTFAEMFGIFAWGFGFDLTVTTLGPLLTKAIPARP